MPRGERWKNQTRFCECRHPKHAHERNRDTLARDGPCRDYNVTELEGGGRDVKSCSCERFRSIGEPDESGPCRRCGKLKASHRGSIGHSYEAKP